MVYRVPMVHCALLSLLINNEIIFTVSYIVDECYEVSIYISVFIISSNTKYSVAKPRTAKEQDNTIRYTVYGIQSSEISIKKIDYVHVVIMILKMKPTKYSTMRWCTTII